jgi:hypothetical protein
VQNLHIPNSDKQVTFYSPRYVHAGLRLRRAGRFGTCQSH